VSRLLKAHLAANPATVSWVAFPGGGHAGKGRIACRDKGRGWLELRAQDVTCVRCLSRLGSGGGKRRRRKRR